MKMNERWTESQTLVRLPHTDSMCRRPMRGGEIGSREWLVAGRLGHVLGVGFIETDGTFITLAFDVQGEKRRKGDGGERSTKQKT